MQTLSKTSPVTFRRFLIIGTALLVILVEVIGLSLRVTTPLERLEFSTRDTLMRLRGVRPPHEAIVIVAVDDFSFNWTNQQWPWPRAYLAEIVNWLNDAGARVIGLDILLFEPDDDPEGDAALAAALAESRAAVAIVQTFISQDVVTLKQPLPIYRETLDGVGITSILLDEDAISRTIQAYDYSAYDERYYYNWAFLVAGLYLGVEPPSAPYPTNLTFNGQTVPLNRSQLMINFAGPAGTYPTYSAARVPLGDYPSEAFRDKIVLIGATTVTLQDVYPTPFSVRDRTPGVEIVANAVATLLTGQYLRVPPPWVTLVIIVAMAALASLINRSPRPSVTIIVMGIGMLIYVVIYYVVFAHLGWYLPITGPELMLFLGVVLPTLEQAVSQELEKRRVRNLFIRFISPEMVDQLLATQDITSLNKRANLTILFSDIRGFTTLSEKLTPEEVVALLNPYLEAMTDVIYQHGGTVDKYEGDAIVAFFGEPVPYFDHALRAVQAAVDMRIVLENLRERWRAEGRLHYKFEIGIGLNTGEAFVGLLGSAQRINYTVIGDNVNLAARLQDLTKVYAWPIIISESTADAIKDEFDVEFVEAATVKGKSEPVKIYKVLGRKDASEFERVRALEM